MSWEASGCKLRGFPYFGWPRMLQNGAVARIPAGPKLTVEYAGAAPGLVAGVKQINVKLPNVIPQVEGYPRGVVPLGHADLILVSPAITCDKGLEDELTDSESSHFHLGVVIDLCVLSGPGGSGPPALDSPPTTW